MVSLIHGFGRVNYITLAHALVSPGFPPSLIFVIKAHEGNLTIFGFNSSHPTTFSPSLVSCVLTACHSMSFKVFGPQDQVSQQTHPLQPGETRVYPSMLADKQVPVLNLTEPSITSQADLQAVFQSICLCSHGREESKEDKNTE